jgi:hypothetical protein
MVASSRFPWPVGVGIQSLEAVGSASWKSPTATLGGFGGFSQGLEVGVAALPGL